MSKIFGMICIFLAMGASIFGATTVPEIDGSSAVTGMALISGALLIARSRTKR